MLWSECSNFTRNPARQLRLLIATAGNVITDGPYTEIKEFISGYMTATIEEAIELAKDNWPIYLPTPILIKPSR